MMQPANPTMPADPFSNPLQVTEQQQAFVVMHYPAYIYNPVDIVTWLFQVAQAREQRDMEEQYYQQQVSEME